MNANLSTLPHSPRGCEICQSPATDCLHPHRFAPLSEGTLLEGYDVVACPACGFCYADRIPGQAVFDTYYAELSKYEAPPPILDTTHSSWARLQDIADRCAPHLPGSAARIFEIGCASGQLLYLLKQRGYPQVSGLEPSPPCARQSAELFGVPIVTGTMTTLGAGPASYDFLILVGVLEHLRDLSASVRHCTRLVPEGGRMFVTIPDASRLHEGEDAPFQEFSLEHINFFGPVSLRRLLAAHGWRCRWLEQAEQLVNAKTTTPVIHAVFERATGSLKGEVAAVDLDTSRGLREYVAKSQRDHQAVEPTLRSAATAGEPLIVWGAGSHTLRLLANSPLREAPIQAIVDANPRYRDKSVLGIPIVSPEWLEQQPGTILVSTRVHQDAICHRIRHELKLAHPLITLY